MKYYPYSVKEELVGYFGKDPIVSMRRSGRTVPADGDRNNLTPLAWQYADRVTMQLFLGNRFLVDTVLEDDYIVYIHQVEDRRCVLLMFMLYESDAPFKIDIAYVETIVEKWQKAGYVAKILSQCIALDDYGKAGSFRFGTHNCAGLGAHIYTLSKNAGQPLLVFDSHRCWQAYHEKLVQISSERDMREYECLFSPDVLLTEGSGEQRRTVARGIGAVKKFIDENQPVRMCGSEFGKSGIYRKTPAAGNKELTVWVGADNLITELCYAEADNADLVQWDEVNAGDHRLTKRIPQLLHVRVLNIQQLHGYAVQLTYADNSIRNYYLHMFADVSIPASVEIDGKVFNENTLKSVVIFENGLSFENGYVIPAHHVYYRSYGQLRIPELKEKRYDVSGGVLQLQYILPLKEFKSHFYPMRYWGAPDECYGPADMLLDKNGRKISDVAFYGYGARMCCGGKFRMISVEPTGRIGVIRENGNWLFPPVYTAAECSENGCVRAERVLDGEKKQFLLTPNGKEIAFPYDIDIEEFYNELCPFNIAKGSFSAPEPIDYQTYGYDNVTAGRWGYVNTEGQIVIEPQYVYTVGFYNGGGSRAVVARLVDGKLRWGAIDTSGKEVIPCIYKSLYTRWGDAFAFCRFEEELYGVMDLDGHVLVDAKFGYFEEYDKKHRLITAGEHEDALGVYSIDRGEMLIQTAYDSIEYGEEIICCELSYSCKEWYFDYTGRELDFSQYDRVHEREGMIETVRGNKCGYVTFDGLEIVPPVLTGNACLALYRKGYIITECDKLYGLSTATGETILPQKYAEVRAYGEFIVVSEETDGNWCVRDTLYGYDGEPIIKGTYRNMRFDEAQQLFTVDTPWGTEHYRLIRK